MFYFAKGLQAAALSVLALALYVGLTRQQSLATELTMMCLGVIIFIAGRMVEKKST